MDLTNVFISFVAIGAGALGFLIGRSRGQARSREATRPAVRVQTRRAVDDEGRERAPTAGSREAERSAHEALEASERRYRAMVDQSPFGVIIVDRNLDLVTANPAYAALVGAESLDALENHNVWKSPAMESLAASDVVARVASGEHVVTELSYTSLFGKRVDVRAHVAPLRDESGAVSGGQILFEDISEQRVLEEQLRQSQKMEAVGRLAGGIAHDFNNYLTVILGYGELIRESTRPGSPLHEAGVELVDTTQRSAALTRQLLTFSKRHVTQPELVDVGDVVAALEPMLRRLLGETTAIVTRFSPRLGRVYADPSLLEQVVVNLAVNAREAMPDGGRLIIETAPAELAREAGPVPAIALRVRDTGCGIDDAVLPHIFEPFFTTRADSGGTGLGLSTVYGIVREIGGEVEVETRVGGGSTFRVALPRAQETAETRAAEARTAPRRPRNAGGDERILVAEDDAAVREIVVSALERRGYRVTAAPNGHAALGLLDADTLPFDLIVTDVRMPGVDGLELSRQAHARWPKLPVLMMTGYSDAIVESDLADGCELLTKPFTPSTMAFRIREILDR